MECDLCPGALLHQTATTSCHMQHRFHADFSAGTLWMCFVWGSFRGAAFIPPLIEMCATSLSLGSLNAAPNPTAYIREKDFKRSFIKTIAV